MTPKCDVPSCPIQQAHFGYGDLCASHGFAWLATQELRDDQIIGPAPIMVDGEITLEAVSLQPLLASAHIEVSAVRGVYW